jgi:hypothetical protein
LNQNPNDSGIPIPSENRMLWAPRAELDVKTWNECVAIISWMKRELEGRRK